MIAGIDPGQRTGIAAIERGIIVHMSTSAPSAVRDILDRWYPRPSLVVFEDSRTNTVYPRRGQNPRAMLRIARSVGEIDQLCREIEETCARLGIECIGVSPHRKGRKLNAKEFAAVTGWYGRSNQHERDAAMCAFRYLGRP